MIKERKIHQDSLDLLLNKNCSK